MFCFWHAINPPDRATQIENIDLTLEEAAHEVLDRSVGTRIGESLRPFNQEWSHRTLRRGAIVLIVSDGWERGSAARLQQEIRYLRYRCHRVIWLIPLLSEQTYQPLVEGITAALPYIDDFLPCHNLKSLEELGQVLAGLVIDIQANIE
jgi:uncharacterized protein with von Willebrand factor type A (vWA) domain